MNKKISFANNSNNNNNNNNNSIDRYKSEKRASFLYGYTPNDIQKAEAMIMVA